MAPGEPFETGLSELEFLNIFWNFVIFVDKR